MNNNMIIEVLFPEVANLCGDLFNAEFLARSCPQIEIRHTSLKTEPLFAAQNPAMIFMGMVTERGQELAVSKLLPYKDRLADLIESGTVFLLTGNAGEVFGTHIEIAGGDMHTDGGRIDCLGLLPFYAERQMDKRYNSMYLGIFSHSDETGMSGKAGIPDNIDIVGFKSQFSHSYGDNSRCGLFKTVRGDGINPGAGYEGVRSGNLFSTYLIGPLLVMNPFFAKYLLGLMGVSEPGLCFEQACIDSFKTRLKEFSDPERNFVY